MPLLFCRKQNTQTSIDVVQNGLICLPILAEFSKQFWKKTIKNQLENGRYGHAPIRYNTSIRVYTTADTDTDNTDTSTPCVGVPATCIIRQGRSLRECSLYTMGGTCRPL